MLQMPDPYELFSKTHLGDAMGYSVYAAACVLCLIRRPFGVEIGAVLLMTTGIAAVQYQPILSALAVWHDPHRHDIATSLITSLLSGGVSLQMTIGAICLMLAWDDRDQLRDVRLGLLLALTIALVAGALATLSTGSAIAAQAPALWATMLLAIGLCGFVLRRDMTLLARPALALPAALALILATSAAITPAPNLVALAYPLVVAGGLLFAQRCFARILATTSIGLTLFGLTLSQLGSQPGGITPPAAIAALGAVLLILLAAKLVDTQLIARQRRVDLLEQLDTIGQMAAIARFELDLTDMTFTPDPAFRAIHGLTGRVRHDWASFVATYVADGRRAALAASLAAARHGQTRDPLAYAFQRPDREPGTAMLRWVPRFDDRGVAVSLTGIVQDLTLQQRSEDARAEMAERRCDAPKLETLGLLACGVAHDLSNTLVPITVLAPLLLDPTATAADQRNIRLIIDAAHRARGLARDMLAYTREEVPAFEPVQLDALVRDSIPLLRARIPAAITIVEALAPVPAVSGNVRQIYQIVLNLAVNAAEAIGARGGTITIGTVRDGDADPDTQSVRLFVSDDGSGIDPALLDRIFEPLFSTRQREDSAGIGLSIVRSIVKAHGGTISAANRPDGGARFDLSFPVSSAAAAAPAAPPVAAGPPRVLLLPDPASEAPWRSASI